MLVLDVKVEPGRSADNISVQSAAAHSEQVLARTAHEIPAGGPY